MPAVEFFLLIKWRKKETFFQCVEFHDFYYFMKKEKYNSDSGYTRYCMSNTKIQNTDL